MGPAAGKERLDASLSKLLALVCSVIVPGFCVAVFVVVSVVCLGVVVRSLYFYFLFFLCGVDMWPCEQVSFRVLCLL